MRVTDPLLRRIEVSEETRMSYGPIVDFEAGEAVGDRIPGEDPMPLAAGVGESCVHPRKRPASRKRIFDQGISKANIPLTVFD
jgi:hypothetical protein